MELRCVGLSLITALRLHELTGLSLEAALLKILNKAPQRQTT